MRPKSRSSPPSQQVRSAPAGDDRWAPFSSLVVRSPLTRSMRACGACVAVTADYLQTRTPAEVFAEFDTDGSGSIDFDEFKAMLPALGFNISEAKALKYFRVCDEDNSGGIDIDEFTMTLYTIDPVSGNTLGFTPSKLLMPQDAFEMFDADRSGFIDEDEFAFTLDYMGMEVTDAKQEYWFKKFDKDKSGKISYTEFKQIWLRLCNVKGELLARGVEVGKWTTKRQMRKQLGKIIEEEELAERKALALAQQWNEWRLDQRARKEQLVRCEARSKAEMANAMDAAGQVYLFGRGSNAQFVHKGVRPDMKNFDLVRRMWAKRVNQPEAEPAGVLAAAGSAGNYGDDGAGKKEEEEGGDDDSDASSATSGSTASTATSGAASVASSETADTEASEEREYNDAATNANLFEGLVVAKNTAPLWGRRVSQVRLGGAAAMCLTDLGELYAWGGNSIWWKTFEPTSRWSKETRGKGKLTPRSEQVMTVLAPTQRELEGQFEQARLRAERKMARAEKKKQKLLRDAQKRAPGGQKVRAVARIRRRGKRGGATVGDDGMAPVAEGAAAATEGAWNNVALVDDANLESDEERERRKAEKRERKRQKALAKKRIEGELPSEAVEKLAAALVEGERRANAASGGAGGSVAGSVAAGSVVAGSVAHSGSPSGALSLLDGGDEEDVDPYDLDEEAEMKLRKEQEEEKERLRQEERADLLQRVTQYYDVWEPAPSAKTRGVFLQNVILPKVTFDQVANTLRYRDIPADNMNKDELVDLVGDAIEIEVKHLGLSRHRELKELEKSVEFFDQRGQARKSRKAKEEIACAWDELMEIKEKRDAARAEERRAKRDAEEAALEEHYRVITLRRKAMAQDPRPFFTPRNTHPFMHLAGTTFRGPKLETFRGGSACRDVAIGAQHVLAAHRDGLVFAWGSGTSGRLGMGAGATGAEDGQADRDRPTVVHALRGMRCTQVAAGFSHSAAVTHTGHLYTWGSAMNGKLGLGPVSPDMYECFCPEPTAVRFPPGMQIKQVACGNAHTAAVTATGQLFVWGNSDAARLGIKGLKGDVLEPVLVEQFVRKQEFISKASCGAAHTVVMTKVEDYIKGPASSPMRVIKGGRVYVAGSPAALGTWNFTYTLVPQFVKAPARTISAGYTHTAVVTMEGELYTWGANTTGCCAVPEEQDFVPEPHQVRALYVAPRNLARNSHCDVRQSSTYNNLGPELAVNGDTSGDGEWSSTHTQREPTPYWEIDLSQNAALEKIVVWNRNDTPIDKSRPEDEFTRRLFPCWVMVAQRPFSTHPKLSLDLSLKNCLYKRRLTKNVRKSVVSLPSGMVGRFVRIQLERVDYMTIAEVEVYGKWGNFTRIGRVTDVACTHGATMVAMAPIADEGDVRTAYRKAIRADSENAVVLRQLPTYYRLYDELGRGEHDHGECPLCTVEIKCERCTLEEKWPMEYPPGPLGRPRRLNSIANLLTNQGPPPLEFEEPTIKKESAWAGVGAKMKGALSVFKKRVVGDGSGSESDSDDSDDDSMLGDMARPSGGGGGGGGASESKNAGDDSESKTTGSRSRRDLATDPRPLSRETEATATTGKSSKTR